MKCFETRDLYSLSMRDIYAAHSLLEVCGAFSLRYVLLVIHWRTITNTVVQTVGPMRRQHGKVVTCRKTGEI